MVGAMADLRWKEQLEEQGGADFLINLEFEYYILRFFIIHTRCITFFGATNIHSMLHEYDLK